MDKHKFPLPELISNLDGDTAVNVWLHDKRRAIADIRTVVGIIQPNDEVPKTVRSLLITSWGILHTGHTLNELEDLLYPHNYDNK